MATLTTGEGWSLTTTETELTEGKHYWEVELLSEDVNNIMNNIMIGGVNNIMIGISRPNLDPTKEYYNSGCTDGWFTNAYEGGLWGNGKIREDTAGGYKQGDRVGVLLDLDNGSLRFFKNGVQHGPGFPAGSVTGPVVAAVQMCKNVPTFDKSVRLLPNVEAPANA